MRLRRSSEAAAEAFEVAQLASTSETGRAIARMAARFAAGEGELEGLARRREAALDRRDAFEQTLMKEISKPPKERHSETEANLRAEITKAETEIENLDRVLAEKFPEYAELTNPQPLPLAKAQSLLAKDEALAIYVEDAGATYVCVVREKDGCFLALKPGKQALAQSVSKLRAGLDPHSGRQVKPLFGGEPEMGGFDIRLANQLYQQLWAPIEPFLTGVKLVFVVPDRTLESLPVHVLVTAMPAEVAGAEP